MKFVLIESTAYIRCIVWNTLLGTEPCKYIVVSLRSDTFSIFLSTYWKTVNIIPTLNIEFFSVTFRASSAHGITVSILIAKRNYSRRIISVFSSSSYRRNRSRGRPRRRRRSCRRFQQGRRSNLQIASKKYTRL